MKPVNFNFKLAEWWDEVLPEGTRTYLRGLHNESYQCMKNMIEMMESDWITKTVRYPICIETHPLAQIPMRKYLLASDAEFLHLKEENAELIVRPITAEEMLHFTGQEVQ